MQEWDDMSKKGFTLIELIIVIAVLAILSALAVVGYSLVTQRANERVCETNRHSMETMYHAQHALDEGLTKESFFENHEDYFDDATCPSGGLYSLEDDVFGCSVHGVISDEDEE